MRPRIAAFLVVAALLLVAFIPAVSAQPGRSENRPVPTRPEPIKGAQRAAAEELAPPEELMPTGDPIRAERHPDLRLERHTEPERLTPDQAALALDAPFAAASTGSESEPNNTPAQADLIAVGDVFDGVINPAGDVDYFKFTVSAGDILRFTNPYIDGSQADTILYLYGTDGTTELAYNGWMWNADAEIVYLFPGAGTYFIGVEDYNGGGPDNNYQLSVIDEGAADTTVVRASVDGLGQRSNRSSFDPALTPDGRYIAFVSYGDNLVTGDWNESSDIFVRDTQTNTIERVSVSTGGDEANSNSYEPAISADGRYVAFYSSADNLVPGDANGTYADIFVHDRQTGTTTLVSRHSDGTQGNYDSYDPSISADGQFVAFHSYADNLVDDDANGIWGDIFVRDLIAGTTILVSRHSDGTQGNYGSHQSSISADGQFVAFVSYADNLVDDDVNGYADIFVWDATSGTTSLISRHSDGTEGNRSSYEPTISGNGQFIAFSSYADNLIDNDDNGDYPDVFVRDLGSGTTTLVSRHTDGTQANFESYGPAISGSGQFIAFFSYADNLIDVDTNGTISDVFMHDLDTGETTLVSQSATGVQGNWYSEELALGGDESAIAFASGASNLVPFDTYTFDVFVRFTNAMLHAVSGRVTDTADNGLGWMRVRDSSGAEVYTDDNGNYVLMRLLPGEHGVLAWNDWYAYLFPETPIPVNLPPSTTGVDIVGTENPVIEQWFTPAADAYVDQATKTANYGTKTYLRVKNAAADMNSYLRFNVTGLSCPYVNSAYLQLFARDPGPDGGMVYSTSNNWTETGINWNNAPVFGDQQGGFYGVADEDYNWAWVGNVGGNGAYSYVVRNNSSDLVQYDSREAANDPFLYVAHVERPEAMPDARYGRSRSTGLAPLTVQFQDDSSGCPTEWEWDFGDGATSNLRNPSHTYTVPGYYPVSLTVTNSKGVDRKTYWIEVIPPVDVFDISPTGSGTVKGIAFTNADILRYVKSTNTWTMVYDGSVRGTPKNIGAFAWDGDDLLMTFSANQVIAGLGTATPFDVVRFTPNNPGVFPLGPGNFSWEFQGKPKGLTTSAEYIDAYDAPWGSGNEQLISTIGIAAVGPGGSIKAQDEDVLTWLPWDGTWSDSLLLDGSAVQGLGVEDVNGFWYDTWTDDLYITILGSFNLGGVTGNGKSIVRLNWADGAYKPYLVQWLAPGATFPSNIDAIDLAR
jgi:PKD repeat protein